MRRRHVSTAILLALAALAACKSTTPDESEVKLIGGDEAKDGQFPWAFAISNVAVSQFQQSIGAPTTTGIFGTASLVHPRVLLTGGHNVANIFESPGGLQPFLGPGKELRISSKSAITDLAEFRTVTIEKVIVHPRFLELCQQDCKDLIFRTPFPPDVGLIVLKEPLTGVPTVPIDFAAPAVGAKVTMLGYGCEKGKNLGWQQTRFRKKFGPSKVSDKTVASDLGMFNTNLDERLGTFYLTKGRLKDREVVGLCPGDSGGPTFVLDESGAARIVGINSQAYWANGQSPEGIPSVNFHTRLDDDSRYKVASWLKGELAKLQDEDLPNGANAFAP